MRSFQNTVLKAICLQCKRNGGKAPSGGACEGLQLLVTLIVHVLSLARSSLLLSILTDKLVVMNGDMFTPDAVVYAIVGICLAGAQVGGIKATLRRGDFATIFNSFIIFSNTYAHKSQL